MILLLPRFPTCGAKMQKWHCAQWQLAKESFTYIPVPAATYAITKHIHDTTNRRTNDSWCIAKVPIPVNSGLLFVVECHSIVSTVTSCSQTKFAALDFHFFTIVRNPQNVSICFVTPCSIISLANIHFLCVIPGYLELAWCLVHCLMICYFALWIKTVECQNSSIFKRWCLTMEGVPKMRRISLVERASYLRARNKHTKARRGKNSSTKGVS